MVGILSFPTPVQAHEPGCTTKKCDQRVQRQHPCKRDACRERVARKHCSQTRVRPCILRAALHHRVSYPLMLAITRCESGFNPHDVNPSSQASGLQFLPSTFAYTPYASRWILSAKWGALAGAWLLRHEGTRPWAASQHYWA